MTNDFQMFPVSGKMGYTVDYSAELSGGTTVSAVAWTITGQGGSPIAPALTGQSNNYAEAQSTIYVTGVQHGARHVLQAVATLTNGEQIPKDVALIGFDG